MTKTSLARLSKVRLVLLPNCCSSFPFTPALSSYFVSSPCSSLHSLPPSPSAQPPSPLPLSPFLSPPSWVGLIEAGHLRHGETWTSARGVLGNQAEEEKGWEKKRRLDSRASRLALFWGSGVFPSAKQARAGGIIE